MAGRTVPLNIAFRVRVSVVCIQCEHTQRKKNKTKIIMFSQINAQGKKGWGVTTSQGVGWGVGEGVGGWGVGGRVFGGNQNTDTDQLKKYGFTTLHWQMGVEWLNKTVH